MKKIIRFTAPWCKPCSVFAPIWESVSKERPDWTWEVINVDNDRETATKYGISSIPTVVMEAEGIEPFIKTGVIQAPQLKKMIEDFESSNNIKNG